MTGSFRSCRSKIQIQMDLLLFASAHTWLPDLGVSHAAEVGFWPSDGFHFISQQICGLTLQDVQHNTVAICHSPGSCQLRQLAEKTRSQNRRQSDLRDRRSVACRELCLSQHRHSCSTWLFHHPSRLGPALGFPGCCHSFPSSQIFPEHCPPTAEVAHCVLSPL